MKPGCLLILLVCTVYLASGQGSLSIQPAVRYGQVLGQPDHFKKQLYGFSIDVSKKTYGESTWQSAHKFPQMGIQFSAFKSRESMMGNVFTLIPYLEFNIWKTAFGTLQVKHGTGLAYVTRCYDSAENPENKLLGTKLNAASILDLGYQIDLPTNFGVKAGISLGHVSNGNLVQPNGGLNSLSGYGSFLFYLDRKSGEPMLTSNQRTTFKRWRYRLSAMTGLYDYESDTHRFHTNNQLGILAFYQHGKRFRTGAGGEVSRLTRKANTVAALYAEEEVLIGHLVTRYGVGYYLSKSGERTPVYEKIGIAWYPFPLKNDIAEKFSIGTSIKAHGFQAAHVEISAGYTL